LNGPLIKKYEVDESSGLPKSVIESYWDSTTRTEKLLKKSVLFYSSENRVIKEAVYDNLGAYRYSICIDYDAHGNITKKTSPLGHENIYAFDELDRLTKTKEIGSLTKLFAYNAAGRQISCENVESNKTTHTAFDPKGRPVSRTDERRNTTLQKYDCFGNCLETQFPQSMDEKGDVHSPLVRFTYDIHGNLTSTSMPMGETSHTVYNFFRKPIRIVQANGTEIKHFYNKNGTLAETLYPDGTVMQFTYDFFQRMTAKKIYSSDGNTLSSEVWTYDAFHLLSYSNSQGLKTTYFYDGAGRKISEELEGRKITFEYDSLGFLEKTNNGALTCVQIHDVEGKIIEQYEQDSAGRIENRMQLFYDANNRKGKAVRLTSQGNAVDLFAYDAEGRLAKHTDPKGAVSAFFYDELQKNALGQQTLIKTSTDPLGNSIVETMDAAGHLISTERKDKHGHTVAKEEIFYDRSGNKAKLNSIVYLENRPIKEIPVRWQHDELGRITAEIEAEKKITRFSYDIRGRIARKTLPSGVDLQFSYDGIGRVLEQKSSDATIHYQYCYELGNQPTRMIDLVHGQQLQRSYNTFGQVTQETSPTGLHLQWEYDHLGRISSFILPDRSAIFYAYSGNHLYTVERLSAEGITTYSHCYSKFDPNGHVQEERFLGQLGSLHTTHDLLERPLSQTSTWLSHTVAYGLSGLANSVTNSLFGNKEFSYDALDQLVQEGTQHHRFDSLGNPASSETNDLNQIISNPEGRFSYDANGNLAQKDLADKDQEFRYDALGRLIEIKSPANTVRFFYDPLSRLLAKETTQDVGKIFYLYDQDKEIGTIDEEGNLLELKVLGLGISKDVGAAIAIEIGGDLFAPLHDFHGNIIAIISSEGYCAETYRIDAFGQETCSRSPVNPWRFSSKRSEEGLVFFGGRFYDPKQGRWLTPDPLGFAEGGNLYLYVRNNPLNRLDLFGLLSEKTFPNSRVEILVPIYSFPITNELFSARVWEHGRFVDYFISCGHWQKINYTPEERKAGNVDILKHISDLGSSKGGVISLVTYQNGIGVSKNEFQAHCQSKIEELPGTFFIGRYNQTEGFLKDIFRAACEIIGIETPEVTGSRQWLVTCAENIYKLNTGILAEVGSLWKHTAHSEAGAVFRRAYEGMTPEQKASITAHALVLALGPALPIPSMYGKEVENVYSNQDFLTGGFGSPATPTAFFFGAIAGVGVKQLYGNSDCDIRFIPCISSWNERSWYLFDHGSFGGTYRKVSETSDSFHDRKYGFYDGQDR
jgi:RHS repeat-associated protein